MTGALLLLWRILFYRPLILVLLLLVYSIAALLLLMVDLPEKGLAVAIMAAFATLGLSAVLAERVLRYALHANALGLPDHARVMRRAQGYFLVLFVAVPVLVASALGANPLGALAALTTAAAAGFALARYGAVWLILLAFLGKVVPLAAWAELPVVQALATALGGYVLWRWLELPHQQVQTRMLAPAPLADAAHEQRERSDESSTLGTIDVQSASDGPATDAVAVDLDSGRRLSAVLALGFGYSFVVVRRALLYGIGTACAVLAAWRVLHGWRPAVLAYAIVTALCCFALVGRLQTLLQRWMQTSTEQALLQLAPRWPEARQIKRAVIETTFLVQRGSIAVWTASSAVAALLGWIQRVELLWGVLAVSGTSLAFTGAVLGVLAHRRIREWHLTTIVIVLTVCAGATIILFGPSPAIESWIAGAGMMLVPPAAALATYCWVPLRLPLDVDERALKAAP